MHTNNPKETEGLIIGAGISELSAAQSGYERACDIILALKK